MTKFLSSWSVFGLVVGPAVGMRQAPRPRASPDAATLPIPAHECRKIPPKYRYTPDVRVGFVRSRRV